ncbi:RuBisCO operon transcriptional regulator CbbR [Caballeronia glathei]|jgi:DNA-binding transcriptional LysR family regulator|uniref:LysR substrate-binding domain-containing protein n=1 Tax=Caballeronia glathei TaxID=60547 RepID=UPI000500BC0E|nr:RuBisCO operon transcriptional regulator CbbR [Caballeronia glathei]
MTNLVRTLQVLRAEAHRRANSTPSPQHPLVTAQQFDLQELRHETFPLRERGSGTRTVAEQTLRNHVFTPAWIVTLDRNESVKQAVMAGMGISLVSLHTPRLELRTREIANLQVNGTPIDRAWPIVPMSASDCARRAMHFSAF